MCFQPLFRDFDTLLDTLEGNFKLKKTRLFHPKNIALFDDHLIKTVGHKKQELIIIEKKLHAIGATTDPSASRGMCRVCTPNAITYMWVLVHEYEHFKNHAEFPWRTSPQNHCIKTTF